MNGRRFALMHLTDYALRELLIANGLIPEGGHIRQVDFDIAHLSWKLVVEHPDFEPVREGMPLPYLPAGVITDRDLAPFLEAQAAKLRMTERQRETYEGYLSRE